METFEAKQSVVLENRKSLVIDGVKNIDSFSENYVELTSKLGGISIEGQDLKIEALNQETGKIYIVGEISGFFYSNTKVAKGFWNKLFK